MIRLITMITMIKPRPFGGYENDILIGGQGEDQLIGGGGKDIFVTTDGDIIVDYNMKDNDILCIDHLLSKENIKLQLKPGDTQMIIQLVPLIDQKTESVENVQLAIKSNPDYFQLTDNKELSFKIEDGLDILSIASRSDLAEEEKPPGGIIDIIRKGSLDKKQVVHLMIMGTAENGKDYPYIPTQITIPEGSDRAEISICPYVFQK